MFIIGGTTVRGSCPGSVRSQHAYYDAAADGWVALPPGPVDGRSDSVVLWTGRQLLVWGGRAQGRLVPPEGAVYDPETGEWDVMARSGLPATAGYSGARGELGRAVWTGEAIVVLASVPPFEDPVQHAVAYDPDADRWSTLPSPPVHVRPVAAAWTGTEAVFWGIDALDDGTEATTGAAYNPVTKTWRVLADAPLSRRFGASSAWTDDALIIWGGFSGNHGTSLDDGAAYLPGADRWTALSASPLGARRDALAVWTGRRMVIWGGVVEQGRDTVSLLNDGAAYDPVADSWQSLAPAPMEGRSGATAVWTGQDVAIWGGGPSPLEHVGAFYKPADG